MGKVLSDKIEKIYPLSPLQEGLYFLKMKEESSTQYVIQNVIEIEGNLNTEIIVDAFKLLSLSYDSLRTMFYYNEAGKPIQIVLKERYIECNCVNLMNNQNRDCVIQAMMEQDVKRGFDFKMDSLMRATIIQVSTESFVILWTFHHIIMDGWSLGILENSFKEYLNRRMKGELFDQIKQKIIQEHKRKPEYSNYIQWIQNTSITEAKKYWSNYLKDYEETVKIKQDRCLDCIDSQQNMEIKMQSALARKIRSIKEQLRVTSSEIFETCWGILLQQFSNTKDVVFGKVISGRNVRLSGAEEIVGLFINTIPTRIDCNENPVISELLQEVHKNSIKSSDYDYVPLSISQACSKQGSELIQSIYTFENYYSQPNEMDSNIKLEVKASREETNYALSLLIYEDVDFHIRLMYDPNCYTEVFIINIIQKYLNIIEQVASSPEKRVFDIRLTNEEEKQILFSFNKPVLEDTCRSTITDVFKEMVQTNAGKTAIVFKDKKVTYLELDHMSNKIAKVLVSRGTRKNEFVGLICDRGIDMIAAMLGIIKVGGAYVPIDPTFPEERIQYIINDCKLSIILTTYEELHLSTYTIRIQEILSKEKVPINYEEQVLKSDNLAYLIYTSGTTGMPKGVAIEHKGIVNLGRFFQSSFNVTSEDNILQFANYVFDASVWEITMALLTGATLVITPKEYINDIIEFEKYCKNNNVTVATLAPQFYIQTSNLALRLLITAGSETNTEILKKALKSGRYVNAYGPTETTVCATYYEPTKECNGIIPIGKAIDNTQVYIMKEDMLCGIGIPGELCVSGIGLAREYLNKQDLTKEKFIDNPFGEGKLYRTGDLARWLSDGMIDFLGRIDEQIKIRGFRIEPGEIERAIRKLDKVNDVAVCTVEMKNQEKVLAAYIVSDEKLDRMCIKESLRKCLPSYMLPDFIVEIDKIPVTRSGKLDKAMLPPIIVKAKDEYVTPRNELESKLCDSIQEVIKQDKIGIYDNIFEFGITSITVINIVLKAGKRGIQLSIQNIYDNPTVDLLSKYLERLNHKDYFIENIKDYEELNDFLKYNKRSKSYVQAENKLETVFITGATGFLGAHIVYELLLKENINIYCAVRGKTISESEKKLLDSIHEYFGDTLKSQMDRVKVLCLDIAEDNDFSKLPQKVDYIIHAAADTKHFGKKENFFKTNVIGTENMLTYAKQVGAKFAYISTSSVCGNVFDENPISEFTEENYFIHQFFISPYMRTKFEAEKVVLEARKEGIDSYIIRVGNLSNRISDGKTTKKLEENRFFALIQAYVQLGCFSERMEKSALEFSPVDLTAKGILLLLRAHKNNETVYHLFNNRKVSMRNLIDVLVKAGYEFEYVDEEVLMNKVQGTLLKDEQNHIYEAITRTDVYDLQKPVKEVELHTEFTDWILENNGFIWPELGNEYLDKVIKVWNIPKVTNQKVLQLI